MIVWKYFQTFQLCLKTFGFKNTVCYIWKRISQEKVLESDIDTINRNRTNKIKCFFFPFWLTTHKFSCTSKPLTFYLDSSFQSFCASLMERVFFWVEPQQLLSQNRLRQLKSSPLEKGWNSLFICNYRYLLICMTWKDFKTSILETPSEQCC